MLGNFPIVIVVYLAAAAVLLLVLAFGGRSGVTRRAVRSFWCSLRARNVTAEFEEKTWDGRRIEVASCTAFEPATDVRCEKQCLTLKRLPPAVKESEAA